MANPGTEVTKWCGGHQSLRFRSWSYKKTLGPFHLGGQFVRAILGVWVEEMKALVDYGVCKAKFRRNKEERE